MGMAIVVIEHGGSLQSRLARNRLRRKSHHLPTLGKAYTDSYENMLTLLGVRQRLKEDPVETGL